MLDKVLKILCRYLLSFFSYPANTEGGIFTPLSALRVNSIHLLGGTILKLEGQDLWTITDFPATGCRSMNQETKFFVMPREHHRLQTNTIQEEMGQLHQ